MTATYDSIATTTLSSAASTITFSSIPNTYTDLRLVVNAIVDLDGDGRSPQIRLNNDTGNNYSQTQLNGSGSAAGTNTLSSQTRVYIALSGNLRQSPNWKFFTIDFMSYAGSTNKTLLSTWAGDQNGAGNVEYNVGLWRNTSAINRIDIQLSGSPGNYAAGTTATLYGIKAA